MAVFYVKKFGLNWRKMLAHENFKVRYIAIEKKVGLSQHVMIVCFSENEAQRNENKFPLIYYRTRPQPPHI